MNSARTSPVVIAGIDADVKVRLRGRYTAPSLVLCRMLGWPSRPLSTARRGTAPVGSGLNLSVAGPTHRWSARQRA